MISGRGGKRPGAGRKSRWNHQPTKTMGRFPKCFETAIYEYVAFLDSGAKSSLARYSEADLEQAIASTLLSISPGERRSARKIFKKLQTRLAETLMEQNL